MEIIKLTLRLPAGLYTTLKQLAKVEKRSLHSQILVLLQEALSQRGLKFDMDDVTE